MVQSPFRSLQDPETLRMLMANLPVGIYISSLSGEVLEANAACLEILGVASLEELRSLKAQDLYEDPSVREREIQRLRSFGTVRNFELRLRRRADGRIRVVLDTCYQVKDFGADQIFYHGVLVDITEYLALKDGAANYP
ncbi:MAG: PAS domain S-box protein [Myxococcales bacterium]|nr:PAS domain S-box protein [Myxococcales bacterium]